MSNIKKKVLLMGKSGSGKTSMRSVIFTNMIAADTSRLGATIDVEHSHVRFLGSLVLNLWDCGGQESFLDQFVSTQKSQIFSNVAILIYVFDATTPSGSPEWEKDVRYFEDCLEALRSNENSEGAGVWVLINKMDLVGQGIGTVGPSTTIGGGGVDAEKEKVFREKKEELERRAEGVLVDGKLPNPIRCFGTSIWDESLYKAWSSVIHTLIPNADLIKAHLTHLRDISSCVEAVLFERQTFLVVAKSGSDLDDDQDQLDSVEVIGGAKGLDRKRFEKISEVIKGFRQTCAKMHHAFTNWEARFQNATIGLDTLSSNTYLMLVSSEPWVEPALLMFNIEQARKHFEELSQPVIRTKCIVCKEHPDCDYQPDMKEDGEQWGQG